MKTLEDGKSKLNEICQVLRKETLEPAQVEAGQIVEQAQEQAQQILASAQKESEALVKKAQETIELKQQLFDSSMNMAVKQSFDELKEKVENQLFDQQICNLSGAVLNDGSLVAKIVSAIIQTIGEKGLSSNLAVSLGENISAEEISQALVGKVAEQLKDQQFEVDAIDRGAQIKIVDQQVTIEISKESLKELLGEFLKDSFRKVLFKNV